VTSFLTSIVNIVSKHVII